MNVMVKKDIHVENRLVEIEVPEDFLGKDVEITIKEKEVKTNTTELEDFFSRLPSFCPIDIPLCDGGP